MVFVSFHAFFGISGPMVSCSPLNLNHIEQIAIIILTFNGSVIFFSKSEQ